MKVEGVTPYNVEADKGKQVERMFDSISGRYDVMNSAMSFGCHKIWRNKALNAALSRYKAAGLQDNPSKILDIATGTGDVAFRLHDLLPEALITGIDLSEGMLEIAREKLASMPLIEQKFMAFGKADCMALPFHDAEFDLLTVAYGVRNFSRLRDGVAEMRRVLKRGGVLCVIELSTPKGFLTKPLYRFYSGKIIPKVGKWVSGDSEAYSYLPESIEACPQREDMAAILYAEGFTNVTWKSLSFGALTYYIAQ